MRSRARNRSGCRIWASISARKSTDLPLEQLREVARVSQLRRVPGAPAGVAGLVNLRGEILCALDVRAILGLPPQALDRVAVPRGAARIRRSAWADCRFDRRHLRGGSQRHRSAAGDLAGRARRVLHRHGARGGRTDGSARSRAGDEGMTRHVHSRAAARLRGRRLPDGCSRVRDRAPGGVGPLVRGRRKSDGVSILASISAGANLMVRGCIGGAARAARGCACAASSMSCRSHLSGLTPDAGAAARRSAARRAFLAAGVRGNDVFLLLDPGAT